MAKFTERQSLYIENRAQGMIQAAAARGAGCAERGAAQQATKYEKNPRIREAIVARKAELNGGSDPTGAEPKHKDYGIEECGNEPLKLMLAVANSQRVPLALRMEAAKQALPYCHNKLGEKSKGENRKDAAKEAAKGKFGKGEAPKHGNVVQMKRNVS